MSDRMLDTMMRILEKDLDVLAALDDRRPYHAACVARRWAIGEATISEVEAAGEECLLAFNKYSVKLKRAKQARPAETSAIWLAFRACQKIVQQSMLAAETQHVHVLPEAGSVDHAIASARIRIDARRRDRSLVAYSIASVTGAIATLLSGVRPIVALFVVANAVLSVLAAVLAWGGR